MAFKSLSQYQEDKNGEFFVLPNDKDYADVIFLYRSVEDVLVADVHYISSASYKGYVHCCGNGCPACNYQTKDGKGIRLDHKIFIPLYNITKGKIEFWDRSTFFEQVLQKSVFGPYPNPSETVFRVTRYGEAGSRDTKYDIRAVGRNVPSMSYEKILADANITLPDGYSVICKEMPASEMYSALNSNGSSSDLQDYGYVPVPRGAAAQPEYVAPSVSVPVPEYSAPPEVEPPFADNIMPEPTEPISDSNDDSGDSLDDVNF